MNILITGATGFVGSVLVEQLLAGDRQVTALVRHESENLPDRVKQVVIGNLEDVFQLQHSDSKDSEQESDINLQNNPLSGVFNDIDVIVHLAARVHVMNDKSSEPLTEFRRINTNATLSLARQAVRAGVRRFIFLSTIKVNGEATPPTNKLFDETDPPDPQDPYAISKWEAEQGLMQFAQETGMEVVIIRPPLVYGPGVKGNFASMMKWVRKGMPLPFGAVRNQRSLLALNNLVDLIICCLEHPKAANQVFLLSDGEDVSTPQLIEKIAGSMGTQARLFSFPVTWMLFTAGLLGKRAVAERLFGSLQIDNRKARELLEWSPVVSMDEQLKKIAETEFAHSCSK